MLSFPLTISLLRSYEDRQSDIRQDVLAVCEAVEYGDSAVALAWSDRINQAYPVREAAERLFAKIVNRTQSSN